MASNKPKHYILEGKEPKAVDPRTWALWFASADRHVASEEVADNLVSTVFLGLDHQFGDGPPLLFETLVFKGEGAVPVEESCQRCSTWAEDEAMHQRGVEYARTKLAN